ncbi:MAG: phosphonate C-P lyase system protein PhnL [Hyphomicrobiaceae bacterium]|nr:phosphonate C-P lyase system protein PhnL [Hyphomicrobiaceae bacterium]
MPAMLEVNNVGKTFILHHQGGVHLRVLEGVDLVVEKGEAVVLSGPSGSGKSTLLRILFGNYRPTSGSVLVRHAGELVDIVAAAPRTVLEVRRRSLGWVSQFLRVIPRVTTLDLVTDPMLARGIDRGVARRRACAMLECVGLPERLWSLAPQTFSGGEQQRVNIARSFVDPPPILLLDEPTASLDAVNRDIVVDLVGEARAKGATVVGIFHDEAVRERVASRIVDVTGFTPQKAAS